MKFKEIAKRLSEIVGTRISQRELRSFSEPRGHHDNQIEIAKQKGITLRGYSEDGVFGKEYGATFKIEGIPDRVMLVAQRIYSPERFSREETVRRALEALLGVFDGKATSFSISSESSYNIV